MHVLDLAPLDGSDPLENHRVIEAELAEHDPRLAELPRVIALSKADLVAPEVAEAAADELARAAASTCRCSSPRARRGRGSTSWRASCSAGYRWPSPPPTTCAGESEVAEFQVFRPGRAQRRSRSRKTGAREFRVEGDAVERLIARHDLENEEALAHVEHRLRRMGVIAALEKEGFEPGDDVEIGGVVFELDPGAPF